MISHGGGSLIERKSGGGGTTNNPFYITPTTYFIMGANTLELYVNSVLRQSWTTTPSGLSGQPIGMLAGITYP